ncbi:MAG: hypothetical protein ACRERV_07625 [Methylococcales bacterium]
MLFFIVVCIFLLIAIPLVRRAIRKSGASGRSSDSSNFSDDSNFYTSSASERYGEPLDSGISNASDVNACDDSADFGSDSDSGSCDSGSDGGSSSD